MIRFHLLGILMSLSHSIFCQTLGTVHLDAEAQEKYILINPVNAKDCYLVDNCGFIVNKWETNYRPGLAAYLDNDGNLYRSGRINSSTFRAGGLGGIIEKYDWNGNKIWEFVLANDSLHLHHDFAILDEGKLMLVAWEKIKTEELISRGRINVDEDVDFYSEYILLIDTSEDFKELWHWRALDHSCHRIDSTLLYHCSNDLRARKFDINLNSTQVNNYIDWLHINSIDVNLSDSLLLLSCNSIDELIVIEWNNNSNISAGEMDGKYGFGGDIIFRWGNAANFLDEPNAKKYLFAQHDANWMYKSDKIEMSLFNNGLIKEGINYSTVNALQFEHTIDELKFIVEEPEIQNIPFSWTYNKDAQDSLYSKRMSSAFCLNDHWIICSSDSGRIFEIDEEGKILWEYINPVGANQIFEQYDIPFANALFSGMAYEEDYFKQSISLTPSDQKIELNAIDGCIDELSSTMSFHDVDIFDLKRYRDCLSWNNLRLNITVFDNIGRMMGRFHEIENDFCLHEMELNTGIYFIHCYDGQSKHVKIVKMVIH